MVNGHLRTTERSPQVILRRSETITTGSVEGWSMDTFVPQSEVPSILNTRNRNLNLDLSIINSLVYYESNASDLEAIEQGTIVKLHFVQCPMSTSARDGVTRRDKKLCYTDCYVAILWLGSPSA
uniref:Uncharacterized protein n=1 Tax=Timema bartmani TaxID=61472 RepID=A0A7R9F7K8_9NEOP|nr:unnamed protein product [Timema bartmani]